MKICNRIFIIFIMLIMIFSVKAFASSDNIVIYNGIEAKIPEVIEGTEDDPLDARVSDNMLNNNVASILTAEVGSSDESISSYISKYGSEQTVVGIDVSAHQKEIDWEKVADSGVKFAIIRCGYRGLTQGDVFQDKYFTTNIQGAINNGIYVGIYFYSTAITEEEALEEAALVANVIDGYNITYPVAYDFEAFMSSGNRTDNLSVDQMHKNAHVFLSYIESKGYRGSLYGSSYYLDNRWRMDEFSQYDTWVAHYKTEKPTYSGTYQMWQLSESGSVPGISGNVDIDIDYSYYASLKTSISYLPYVQNVGWLKPWKYNGQTSGTVGSGLRLEGIRICLTKKVFSGTVQYRTHIQNKGWETEWKSDNEISGTTGESLRLEAIQIRLTEDMAKHCDVYYRVHVQDFGWLGWAKNGASAGTEGYSKRIEAIEVKLVPSGYSITGSTDNCFIRKSAVKYRAYVRNVGWQNYTYENAIAGTTGLGKKLEALQAEITTSQYEGGIEYRSYIQNTGWESEFKRDGEISANPNSDLRIEAMQFRLYGEMAERYDIYYRVHSQNKGWLGWAKNGESAGTLGYGLRIEAFEIKLVDKGKAGPTSNTKSLIRASEIRYKSYIRNNGWQNYVYENSISGTTGKGIKIEAFQLELTLKQYSGGIEYRSHIQNIGWENTWESEGEVSGTPGSGLNIEAIQIKLTGEMAEKYDIYYRVHSQNKGWLGWAKNGESAGTSGYGYRIEAYQIVLVDKGDSAPGSTTNCYVSR